MRKFLPSGDIEILCYACYVAAIVAIVAGVGGAAATPIVGGIAIGLWLSAAYLWLRATCPAL